MEGKGRPSEHKQAGPLPEHHRSQRAKELAAKREKRDKLAKTAPAGGRPLKSITGRLGAMYA